MSKGVWIILTVTMAAAVLAGLYWLPGQPGRPATEGDDSAGVPGTRAGEPFRIGLIPERDPFKLRRQYRVLAEYLSARFNRPVELVTVNTYEGALADLAENKVEGAFLGSLVAVLAMDRLGAKVLAKPEYPGDATTYHGVLFVRDDSPIRQVKELAGRKIGQVRTTTAGHLFPAWLLARNGLLATPDAPRVVWIGTHDEVARAVADGAVDAGAIKNLRLEAMLREHPEWKFRPLAVSDAVPTNGLVVRGDLDEGLCTRLRGILLAMTQEPEGRKTLEAMGMVRFLPCGPEEYGPIYEMSAALTGPWRQVGIGGLPPRRPASRPGEGG